MGRRAQWGSMKERLRLLSIGSLLLALGCGGDDDPVRPQGGTPKPSAYVINQRSGDMSVIDLATRTVTATVPIASILTDIAITPDGAIAYVTLPGVDQVFEIELATNTVTASVPVQNGPVDVAITPSGAFAYVFAQRACRSPVELITASRPLERQGPRPVQPC